jgi:hypothetical protein
MNYSVFFDESEIQLLKSLVGKTIDEIQIPGAEYSIRFLCGNDIFDFSPQDFFTPEKGNDLARVTRPIVSNDCSRVTFHETKTIAENLGAINTIQILRTASVFTPVTPIGHTIIGKLEIPTTSGWDNILIHPKNPQLKISEQFSEKSLVQFDIGVFIKTTSNHKLHICTDGFSCWVTGKLDKNLPDELEGKIEYLSLH